MPDSDSYTIHNSHKLYPDGTQILIEFKTPFKITLNPNKPRKKHEFTLPESKRRADMRAKTMIKDYAKSNKFDLWMTFTFDPKKVSNRYDLGMCRSIMQRWMKTQSRKYGTFDYLIVPELCKDGAIHFHALFGRFNAPLHDSGKVNRGAPVYNLKNWTYGFTTIQKIPNNPEDYSRITNYLTKYITKDMPHFPGKKRYFASSDLKKPIKTVNFGISRIGQLARYIVRRKLFVLIVIGYASF